MQLFCMRKLLIVASLRHCICGGTSTLHTWWPSRIWDGGGRHGTVMDCTASVLRARTVCSGRWWLVIDDTSLATRLQVPVTAAPCLAELCLQRFAQAAVFINAAAAALPSYMRDMDLPIIGLLQCTM
jgi:hypothetical protein